MTPVLFAALIGGLSGLLVFLLQSIIAAMRRRIEALEADLRNLRSAFFSNNVIGRPTRSFGIDPTTLLSTTTVHGITIRSSGGGSGSYHSGSPGGPDIAP